jgi:hypothetical protein
MIVALDFSTRQWTFDIRQRQQSHTVLGSAKLEF